MITLMIQIKLAFALVAGVKVVQRSHSCIALFLQLTCLRLALEVSTLRRLWLGSKRERCLIADLWVLYLDPKIDHNFLLHNGSMRVILTLIWFLMQLVSMVLRWALLVLRYKQQMSITLQPASLSSSTLMFPVLTASGTRMSHQRMF